MRSRSSRSKYCHFGLFEVFLAQGQRLGKPLPLKLEAFNLFFEPGFERPLLGQQVHYLSEVLLRTLIPARSLALMGIEHQIGQQLAELVLSQVPVLHQFLGECKYRVQHHYVPAGPFLRCLFLRHIMIPPHAWALWLCGLAATFASFIYYFRCPDFCALWVEKTSLQCQHALHKLLEYCLRLYIVFLEARYVVSRFGLLRALRRVARRHYRRMFLPKL